MRNITIPIFLVIVLVFSGCTISVRPEPQENIPSANIVQTDNQGIKEFTVHGSSFKFEPFEIKVKKGDTVRINYISDDIGHNLLIDEFNVRTNIISSGDAESIEFIADKEGTFAIYCSVGQHRALGMEGILIVEP